MRLRTFVENLAPCPIPCYHLLSLCPNAMTKMTISLNDLATLPLLWGLIASGKEVSVAAVLETAEVGSGSA